MNLNKLTKILLTEWCIVLPIHGKCNNKLGDLTLNVSIKAKPARYCPRIVQLDLMWATVIHLCRKKMFSIQLSGHTFFCDWFTQQPVGWHEAFLSRNCSMIQIKYKQHTIKATFKRGRWYQTGQRRVKQGVSLNYTSLSWPQAGEALTLSRIQMWRSQGWGPQPRQTPKRGADRPALLPLALPQLWAGCKEYSSTSWHWISKRTREMSQKRAGWGFDNLQHAGHMRPARGFDPAHQAFLCSTSPHLEKYS